MAQKIAIMKKAGALLCRYVHKIECDRTARDDAVEPEEQGKDRKRVRFDPDPFWVVYECDSDFDDAPYSPDDRGEIHRVKIPRGRTKTRGGRSRRR